MADEEKLSSRLDTLLEAIFAHQPDPFSLYWEIAAELHPAQYAVVQKRIQKRLQQRWPIESESALLVACVLSLTGFPAHRTLHFLSLYLTGTVSMSQFELAVGAIFMGEQPLSETLVYDMTRYTYLEKRLLVRKAMEISARLKETLEPKVLLYLYLLSLRDDLSNENVQLISLVMRSCFPDLEVRTRLGGATLEEYGELAKAWKSAERRSFSADLLGGGRAETSKGFDRDSASFFLDKYFSDKELSKTAEQAADPVASVTASERRAAARREAARLAAAGRAAAQAAARREANEKLAAAPTPRKAADSAPRKVPARRAGPRPAAAAHDAAAPVPDSRSAIGSGRFMVLRALPFLVAAVLCLGLTVLWVREIALPTREPAAAVAPAAPSAPPSASSSALSAPPPQASTDTGSYVVQRGDTLWKIFKSRGKDSREWKSFLSSMQATNDLPNPNLLRPGKVLSISTQ
jgi:nucleoid-associated protein YgaU